MPLPHFTNIPVASDLFEPVYLNLFECTFILPTILQAQGRDPFLLLQQATNVDLNLTPSIDVKEQRFKYSTRAFMGTPGKTHIDFKINFQVNVNNQGSMETWNTLKAWYDLVWNSQNGTAFYKSDIIGTIIVNEHDKKGVVLRRVTFQNCQITEVGGISLKWEGTGDLWTVDCGFVADYWIDEYIDGNFTIQPPLVSGY